MPAKRTAGDDCTGERCAVLRLEGKAAAKLNASGGECKPCDRARRARARARLAEAAVLAQAPGRDGGGGRQRAAAWVFARHRNATLAKEHAKIKKAHGACLAEIEEQLEDAPDIGPHIERVKRQARAGAAAAAKSGAAAEAEEGAAEEKEAAGVGEGPTFSDPTHAGMREVLASAGVAVNNTATKGTKELVCSSEVLQLAMEACGQCKCERGAAGDVWCAQHAQFARAPAVGGGGMIYGSIKQLECEGCAVEMALTQARVEALTAEEASSQERVDGMGVEQMKAEIRYRNAQPGSYSTKGYRGRRLKHDIGQLLLDIVGGGGGTAARRAPKRKKGTNKPKACTTIKCGVCAAHYCPLHAGCWRPKGEAQPRVCGACATEAMMRKRGTDARWSRRVGEAEVMPSRRQREPATLASRARCVLR